MRILFGKLLIVSGRNTYGKKKETTGFLKIPYGTYEHLMRNLRIIAKLDVKPPFLVKGIQFEGLRQLGDPNEFAQKYYKEGIDEIIYDDIVASLYERNSLEDIIKMTSNEVFVPITVGGGIRSIKDIRNALRAGADKVSINTEAIKNSKIISEAVNEFGSSTLVLTIQAKKVGNSWEAYYDNGRERSYKDVIDWAKEAEDLGVGEILIISVDNEGTLKGFDLKLINSIMNRVTVPVIACGGLGKLDHVTDLIKETSIDAIALASALHYNKLNIKQIKDHCTSHKLPIRV